VPVGFVRIEPGTFTMGSPDSEEGRYEDNREVEHRVTLTRAFWLGRTEVTQAQWKVVMGTNPSSFSACGPECPVETVSWDDAVAYLNKLSDREGLERCYGTTFKGLDCRGYRLPTEAEWEYAARAGSTGARYGELEAIAWYAGNTGPWPEFENRLWSPTRQVGLKAPNRWGLHDMLGNVWEWTGDWFGDYVGSSTDPVGPDSGKYRVRRGGGYDVYARNLRAAVRAASSPDPGGADIGFRAARTIPSSLNP
jgi:formylglycine-generating enzyme required for sulfatase activity